jgi:uncharacterized protein
MNTPQSTDRTRLGSVEDVVGPRVTVKLSDETAHGVLFIDGEGYRIGQVGTFVRIPSGYFDLFGIVSQVGAGAAPGPPDAAPILGTRWLRVELVGEGRRGETFQRGISQYPSIGDSVHVVTESDLQGVYAPGDLESHVAVGRIASAEGITAFLNINKLVSRHASVLGSTGAGKSTAVTSLLQAVSDPVRYPATRVVLLDLHGEYANAFGDVARVFRIGADASKGEHELHIPFWALNSEELVAVSLGPVSGTILSPLLDRITTLKRASSPAGTGHNLNAQDITVDTPLPFSLHRLWYDLHCQHFGTHTVSFNQNQTDETIAWLTAPSSDEELRGDALSVRRPSFRPLKDLKDDPDKVYKSAYADQPRTHVETLENRLRDPRLRFLFEPGDWSVCVDGATASDLDLLLQKWTDAASPITVIDLSGIPKAVLDDLVGALLRILYDAAFWGRARPEGGRQRPLLLVLEEAHVYLGANSKGRAANVARQIAKEGRKYGVGLMLVSQRPSEVDPTILSQCGTLVAMRLTNESDQGQVRSCAADNLEGLFAMLPILRTGEALVVGEAVGMPMRTLIDLPPVNRRPSSDDPLVVVPKGPDGIRVRPGGWTEKVESEDYSAVVRDWRLQQPGSKAEDDGPEAPKASVAEQE